MNKTNPPIAKRATPPATGDPQNDNTRIPYHLVADYLLDIPDANIFRLLLELHREVRKNPRVEFYHWTTFRLAPWQGILKGGVLANKWHVHKSTIWRWARYLKREKLMQCTMQRGYTVYTLTKLAFPDIRWSTVQHPQHTPRNTPENPRLNIKYQVLNKDIDSQSIVMNNFKMSNKDFATTQGLVLKNSPCSDWKDSGLNHEKLYWLITGVCLLNHRDCSGAEKFCIPHLKRFSEKLKKYPLRDPTAVKKYIEVMLGNFQDKRR